MTRETVRSFRRRRLLRATACSPFLWASLSIAQSPRPLVGYIATASREGNAPFLAAFKEGLAAYGWKEGSTVLIEARWADSRVDRLSAIAQELAALKPAVIVASPNSAVKAATKAAPSVPIVQANGTDPVTYGLAASQARPGGMVTGLANANTEIGEKYVELLLAAMPNLRRVGVLSESVSSVTEANRVSAVRLAFKRSGINGVFAYADSAEKIEPAMQKLAAEGAQALIIWGGNLFPSERRRIARLALRHRWPAIGALSEYAEEGALLSYGANRPALHRRAAYYVDKILRGSKPSDLPIEFPTKFDLVVNGATAKKLGIVLSQELLLRADKVIE